MAMGAMSVTVTIVAATGIYFFDKSHTKAQELGSRMRSSGENMVAKVKKTKVVINDKPWTSPSFSKTLLTASVVASHALIRHY
ncbi:hypothetical protein POTOM_041592 [Populus tomentosa]|uniref:Uncharacterized protein n=1 Tax=Populus tomentosa TaxID=118781 RepID=A0A8X7YYT5_POPTO|nr:hypothetical protein POTOM_041592 [Populus tomentosa]